MKKIRKSEQGSVLPMFVMGSVVMMLILFLIFDIGKIHMVQSDAYKAADAASLAGASQSDSYEQVNYKQVTKREAVYRTETVYNYDCRYDSNDKKVCVRVPPYSIEVFDHWKYTTLPAQRTVVDNWAEIRKNDAFKAADEIFWDNANESSLTESGQQVQSVNPTLTAKDKIQVGTDVSVQNVYFPSFAEGFFNAKDVPKGVLVHKESESQAKSLKW